MPYLPSLNVYLHTTSLLLQAYPTSRITTKYSLPRKSHSKSSSQPAPDTDPSTTSNSKPKRDPAATLTLKTYAPEAGICLKYRTDKAAEVGRLLAGLGRIARGEAVELPAEGGEEVVGSGVKIGSGQLLTAGGVDGDAMEVDSAGAAAKTVGQMTSAGQQQQGQGQGQSGGGKKKKKGKK